MLYRGINWEEEWTSHSLKPYMVVQEWININCYHTRTILQNAPLDTKSQRNGVIFIEMTELPILTVAPEISNFIVMSLMPLENRNIKWCRLKFPVSANQCVYSDLIQTHFLMTGFVWITVLYPSLTLLFGRIAILCDWLLL